jgi:hypothetical protein
VFLGLPDLLDYLGCLDLCWFDPVRVALLSHPSRKPT